MKKWMIALLLVAAVFPVRAQWAERVYLATDRDWYAAGETVYLSAFCVDRNGAPSLLSGIAYVELTSLEGYVLGGRVALQDGRGAGSILLPRTLPTGNYRLSAYTSLSGASSRIVSVYNTLSTARVEGGVQAGSLPQSQQMEPIGPIQAERLPDGRISLNSSAPASVSVSVFRKQPFPSYGRTSIAMLLQTEPEPLQPDVVPEYDGESITLHLSSPDGTPLPSLTESEVLLSRPAHPGDVYYAPLEPDGTARFYTCNFFGEGDLVVILEKDAPPFQVQRDNPFRELPSGDIPSLVLDPSLSDALASLGARMQVTSAFEADTLFSRLPVREIPFASGESIRYVLDDYTRFATMQEVFTEYLFDIRSRGKRENLELQVRCRKSMEQGFMVFRDQPSLIMVDGVPVRDHQLVYNMDPALVQFIDIYPYSYVLGRVYSGVANFITFKGDLGGLRMGDNVRFLNNVGASYPVSFGPTNNPRYPNVRETLLWQPLLQMQPGQELVLPPLEAPEGMVLTIEGITRDGAPIYYQNCF